MVGRATRPSAQELRRAVLLVLANKQDLEGAMTPVEITQQLARLPRNKKPGRDLVSNEMLQHLGTEGRLFLKGLVNRTLHQGETPAWRRVQIIPIDKNKGPRVSVPSLWRVTLRNLPNVACDRT